jgi:toxin ParE1/3/4
MAVAFSAWAARDPEEIGDFMAQDSPARAVAFVQEMRAHVQALNESPGIGAPRPEYGPDVRVLRHCRYLIFHSQSGGDVLIERVLHSAREIGDLYEE